MTMTRPEAETALFQPFTAGGLKLKNRIVMAPLTRCRSGEGDVPQEIAVRYYVQRATSGLIISEATHITDNAKGYMGAPGIYSDAQVAGWKKVIEGVHGAGGLIVCQLWHVGRISHQDIHKDGSLPVAPSAIAANGHAHTPKGNQPFPTPRALETSEIPGLIADYVHAAQCAKRAGFDGIEIHAANGYLLDEFLRDGTNHRTDQYGGSIENRCRLVLNIVKALIPIWGNRTGIRISPVTPEMGGISDSNPQQLFEYLVTQLNEFDLAYIHVLEGQPGKLEKNWAPFDYAALKKIMKPVCMVNNSYTKERASAALAEDRADLFAFGKAFIANPDLVERLKTDAPLNGVDFSTLYTPGEKGYTDYPFLGSGK